MKSATSSPATGRSDAMRWLALLILLLAGPAWAEDFNVPGLQRDAAAYAATLTAKSPAGLTPVQRRQAEQRAADATKRNDWPAVTAAIEARLGGGEPTPDLWMALARAHLAKKPPEPGRAAQAAWQAYAMLDEPASVPALLLLSDAFRAQERWDFAIRALEAAQERAPDNKGLPRLLTDDECMVDLRLILQRAQECLQFRLRCDPPRRDMRDWNKAKVAHTNGRGNARQHILAG